MTTLPTLLIVEDQPPMVEWYEQVLAPYPVITAYRGQTALDRLNEDVDIVLLDRKLPDMSGEEVLRKIRERDIFSQVVMVTGIEPDFDILDMPFDDYLVKPVDIDELTKKLEVLQKRSEYNEALKDHYTLARKRSLLEAEKTRTALEANPDFLELEAQIETLESKLDDLVTDFDEDDFIAIIRSIQ